jgi:mono/diheme cytochrome c family protein
VSLKSLKFLIAALAVFTSGLVSPATADDTAASYYDQIAPILENYCYNCHGDGAAKGKFSMDEFKDLKTHLNDEKHWLDIWRNVRSQIMPPSDKDQLGVAEKRELMAWIEKDVFMLDPENPDPGRVTIRRLNRTEYQNAVYDLLGVEYDTTEVFPADDTGYGFDNIGDVLSISPLLMEKYLAAADEVVALALPDGAAAETPRMDIKGYKTIFVDGLAPDDEQAAARYARKIMRRFVSRAFRKPLDDRTINRLVDIVRETDREPGKSFEDGIRMAIAACLASPRFLFRIEFQPEPNNPKKVVLLDEYSLASRLSFFLWGSVPDDELLSLAFQKMLRENLTAQIDRMLADPKSQRMVTNFVGQWLQTRDVPTVAISAKAILGTDTNREAAEIFDPRLRGDMRQETERFFDFILREERPLEELISANYSILNERLAKFYGIKGVKGDEFRVVDLAEHPERGGVLAQGAFLLVTSNPTRTSAVKRGLFVLENFLGTPAPPAPPGVPALEDAATPSNPNPTQREMMEIHRRKPECRNCHARMDPIGLGLENYNALGQFRRSEHGKPIDSSGKLVTGEKFADVASLKTILADKRREDFYRCFSEKLLTFAIGRGMEIYDATTIDLLTARLIENKGNLRDLIQGVIESAPFQKRRGDG